MRDLFFLRYLHPLKYYSISDLCNMVADDGNKALVQTRLANRLKKRAETFTHYQADLVIDGQKAFAGFLWISSVNDLALNAPHDMGPPKSSLLLADSFPMLRDRLALLPMVWVPSECTNAFIGGVAFWEPYPPTPYRRRLNMFRKRKQLWGVVR